MPSESPAKMAELKGEIMGLMRNQVRNHLLAAVAMGAMVIAAPAQAQSHGGRRDYSIEAGDLGDALRSVSRQSGREIIFGAEAVSGKRAPPLRGTYSADDAVRALLVGSGLTAEFRRDVILIRGRSEPSGALEDRSADNAEIVVTGSHIRGAPSAAPVSVSDRQSIQNSGLPDLGSFVRTIPQNFNGGQNPGVAGGGSQGNGNQNLTNSSALNLRGLGPDATLTLINGHRVAYDAIGQGVDISAIPLAAVDRVEIVADGSSALYGSDAVGGVANVILRRDFQGVETSARFGASTDGGNEQQEYSLVGGKRWSSGGFMTAIDYSKSTAIMALDRSYTRTLDDSAVLVPRQKQISAVVAAHQKINDSIVFELDGEVNDRKSLRPQAFFTNSSAYSNGNVNQVEVRSYSVAPVLKFRLPANWQATLSAVHGDSKADLHSRRFLGGTEASRSNLTYDNRTDAIEFGADGPLFRTAGGLARLAIGGGYRRNKLDVFVDMTRSGVTTVTSDFSGKQESLYGYGELSLPVIGAANSIAFAKSLQFSAAVRYEDYRGIAHLATPKFGLVYEPLDDITIRASWGKSFKTQTLFQQFQLTEGYLFPAYYFAPSRLADNATVLLVTGGNRNLKPERATTWSATIDLHPRMLDGLNIQASYFNIRYRDRVAVPISALLSALSNPDYNHLVVYSPSAAMIADVLNGLPAGLSNQTGAPFDPAGVGAFVDDTLQNTARENVRGVDLAASFKHDLGSDGKIDLSASASYLESDRRLIAGQLAGQRAGTIFNSPHWRGRIGGSWDKARVGISAFVNYIGGVEDNRYSPTVSVGSFTTLDLIARIRPTGSGILGGIEAALVVQNALNEKPSVIRNNNPADPPYDSTNYSVVGRFISLTLTKRW